MLINVPLLHHQYEFVNELKSRYVGLVGGYGCGKTFSFCVKGLFLSFLNAGFRGVLLQPTNAMCHDVLIPELQTLLYDLEIPHEYRASPLPYFNIHFKQGTSQVLIRSAENFRRLVSLNLAFFGVDEIDIIKREIAWAMFRLLQSRLRAKAPHIQGFFGTTPEGYNFAYEFFYKSTKSNRRLIQARTYDNPYLPPNYIEDLLENYPSNLIRAYLDGQFTNLQSGTVYENFDRKLNHTSLSLNDPDTKEMVLHIGQDFNIGKMASIIHVIQDNKPRAVGEIVGAKNTQSVIDLVRSKFKNRKVIFYVDSSGKSQHTNASATDISLLKQYFEVRYPSSNPFVRDRVGSMNAQFLNGKRERRYLINTDECPNYTEALEQQVFNKAGEPDKTHDQDHPNDAGGYFIHYMFPVSGRKKFTQYGIVDY